MQGQAGSDGHGAAILDAIDTKAFGAFQLKVVLLCLLAQLVDGFDNQASAFVAPALAGHWDVARDALGPVFAAGAFGTLVGSLLIGPAGDLLGRNTLIVISLALVAILMALTGAVSSIHQLIAIRFLTGLPLGALIPGTIVVANEWSPVRSRAAMVTIMACGFALGAVLGGLLSSFLLPRFGWPSVFHAGAAGTALIGAAVLLCLPESLRFLSLRQRRAQLRAHRVDPAPVRSCAQPGAAPFRVTARARPDPGDRVVRARPRGDDRPALGGLLHEHAGAQLHDLLAAEPAQRRRRDAGRRLPHQHAVRSSSAGVLKATGGLETPLAAALVAAGVPVAVVNPRQVRDYARPRGSWPRPTASMPWCWRISPARYVPSCVR